MDEEKLDLLGYLPPYLRAYGEMQQVMGTEGIELEELSGRHLAMVDDCFITSCGQYGMERFEKLLGIMPLADDTLEARRFRVLSKWNNARPYNYAFLESQIRLLCGSNGYRLSLDRAHQALTVKVALTSKNMLGAVREFLADVMPCNVVIDVGLMYNQHGTLRKSTHGQLASYTHKQLREDVIP